MSIRQILVATLYQVFWFVAVLGEQRLIILTAGLALAGIAFFAAQRLLTLLALVVSGLVMDALLIVFGVYSFAEFPFWLGLMWLGFGVWLLEILPWLLAKPLWLQLGFMIAGPMSYFAAVRMEALQWPMGIELTLVGLYPLWLIHLFWWRWVHQKRAEDFLTE